MTEAYWAGFLAKCAEAGVDPQVLLQPTTQPVGTGPGAEPPPALTGTMSTALTPAKEPDKPRKRATPTPPIALTLNQRT
jgi:hypothetical protein